MSFYNEDYFEKGEQLGISGYTRYRWLPQATIPLAHAIVDFCNLPQGSSILDYGCAKGFLVRAFREIGFKQSFGVDVSPYAISNRDPTLPNDALKLISNPQDLLSFSDIDLTISKDVFEHIPIPEIIKVLKTLSQLSSRLFVIVPLADPLATNRFIIDEYHKDISHITFLSLSGWAHLFEKDWDIIHASTVCPGVKQHWQDNYPLGNGFFLLSSRRS